MIKITNFHSFIKSSFSISESDIKITNTLGKACITGTDWGNYKEIGQYNYVSEISIDNFQGGESMLLAQVMAWLATNDSERFAQKLQDPDIKFSTDTNGVRQVDIVIYFEEPIIVVEDVEGQIHWVGKTWKIGTVSIDVAQKLSSLNGSVRFEE